MAQYRTVNPKFWDDPYISELPPSEKLVFLYLLTNTQCNIAGVYELQAKRASFDTGIERDTFVAMLERLQVDRKIFYADNWIGILNFAKNQASNPSTVLGIVRTLSELPDDILSSLVQCGYSLPPGYEHIGWLDRINEFRSQKRSRSDQELSRLDQTGIPNLTLPNLTKPNLTADGQSGSASLPPGFGRSGSKYLVLGETELDQLNAEFPEINVDREYLAAQHSANIRKEPVEKPLAFMRSRLDKIRQSNQFK